MGVRKQSKPKYQASMTNVKTGLPLVEKPYENKINLWDKKADTSGGFAGVEEELSDEKDSAIRTVPARDETGRSLDEPITSEPDTTQQNDAMKKASARPTS